MTSATTPTPPPPTASPPVPMPLPRASVTCPVSSDAPRRNLIAGRVPRLRRVRTPFRRFVSDCSHSVFGRNARVPGTDKRHHLGGNMLVASISGQVEEAFKVFFAWLPNLVGALVVLLLGYIVAKVVGGLVAKATGRAGLDRSLHSGPGGNYVSKVTSSPSRLLGTVVFWLIFLGAISL